MTTPDSTSPPPAHDDEPVLDVLRRLAEKELSYDGPLEREQRLVEDLRLDSIRLLTLALAVEDHFRICLDEADEERLVTVGDLVDTIETKRAESADADG
ncbi:MAG: acyl carrier protein [Acidobacteriota bacterium]